MNKAKTVDEYIASAPKEVRGTSTKLRRVIKKAAPKADERISYGMPFYEYGGAGYKGRLIYFAVFKNHISVFIPPSLKGYPKEFKKYQASKSSFHFTLNEPMPFALIGKTVQAIMGKGDKKNKVE